MSKLPNNWTLAAASLGAAVLVSLAAGCRSDPPEVSLKSGMEKLLEGDFRGAVRRLERAARLLPDSATAYGNLGIAYWKLGQNGRATAAFRKASDLDRTDARSLEFLGQVLLQMGKKDEARTAFDEASQRGAPHARLFTEMAVVEIASGKPEQAETFLKHAIQLDPGYPPALYNLAVLARDARQSAEDAGVYFRKYLKVAGDDPHADIARRFLSLPVDKEKSVAAQGPGTSAPSKPATKSRPPAGTGPVDPLLAVARSAIEKEAYDEALVMLNQAIKKDATNADALWQLAILYEQHLGYRDSAAQMYRKFRQLFPDDPRSGGKSAAPAPDKPVAVAPPAPAAIKSQKPPPPTPAGKPAPEAPRKEPVQTAAGAVPLPGSADLEDAQEDFLKGLNFQKAQDWDSAIRSYKSALEHNPNFAEASYNLGLAYKDSGDPEMAKDALLYALTVKPGMTRAGYMLSIVYMETKDNEKAIAQLKRVLKLEPNNAKAHYLIGLAYRTELHFDEAKTHFERYIELEPNEPPAREAREWLDSINKRSEKR